ncbi:ATP-binding cassette domain-containing protein [Robiginitalea sp.]|uniref:ATP-binding cassette domain-containing protein n=1 Tax=Robiginitalea sp. TaxID=1902411 RepID=UPI003C784F2F
MSLLQVDSIRKSWKQHPVLTDIFFTCQTGKVVGLLGSNGSGKSTLFRIIYGDITCESRFVKVDETVLNSLSLTRKYLNYLPEHPFLPEALKVGAALRCLGRADLGTIFKNDAFLSPLLPKKVMELSFGERRFVEIITVLYGMGSFVLLDEPFKGLGPLIKEQIIHHISQVKRHKGIILTDHDAAEILALSDKILLLGSGYLRKISQKSELIDGGYLPADFQK